MNKTCCLVLAAGIGKRMLSDKPKVLSTVLFEPMIQWVMSAATNCDIKDVCVVTGYKSNLVEECLKKLEYNYETVIQKQRKGTAHAVITAESFLKKHIDKDVLILGGDAPFISESVIRNSYNFHKEKNNSATIISSRVENPFGYGRIVRNQKNYNVAAIVEEKDAVNAQRAIKEINSGAYWFKVDDLLKNIYDISNDTAQKEYYLTSVIKILIDRNFKVDAFETLSSDVALGANDCSQLRFLNEIARKRVIDNLISMGANIPCCDGVVIGRKVKIGEGTTIFPGTILNGKTSIGKGCIIGPNTQVIDSTIGDGVEMNSSYCKNSNISSNLKVGPFESLVNLSR